MKQSELKVISHVTWNKEKKKKKKKKKKPKTKTKIKLIRDNLNDDGTIK